MDARITSTFRIREAGATRKYTPGEVATGATAKWAVENGYGEALKANPAPKNKATRPGANK